MPDTVIQIGLFFVKCGALHLFLRILRGKHFDKSFLRTVIAMGAAFGIYLMVAPRTLKLVGGGETPSMVWLAVAGATLFGCAFPFVRYVLRPGRFLTLFTCSVLAAISVGLDHVSGRHIVPHQSGESITDTLLNNVPSIPKGNIDADKAMDLVNVVRDGADTLAKLTEKQEVDSIGSDFRRGLALFKERKEWMDNLTPEEKAAYKEEMQQFLAEQGIEQNRFSLAALKSVDPANMQQFTTLFEGLETMETTNEVERSQSISKSLSQIASNLKQLKLSKEDMETMQQVAELVSIEDTQSAMDLVASQIEDAEGKNELAGTLLAALMQSKTDMPLDSLLAKPDESSSPFNIDALLELKQKIVSEEKAAVQTSLVDAEIEETDLEVTGDSHIPITTSLGVVHVPSDPEFIGEWTTVIHSLYISGFVSLGAETVILLDNGTMYRNGDIWQLENKGYQYRFSVDKVMKNKVHLTGIDRIEVPAEEEAAL